MPGTTKLNRRCLLTAPLVLPAVKAFAGSLESPQKYTLSARHQAAVNRRRRIVVQYDAWGKFGHNFDEWLDYRFDYIDDKGSQIDSVFWDLTALGYATYPSKVLKPFRQKGLDEWRKQGIDWVDRLTKETKKRNLECFWSHRISEVEMNATGTGAGWKGKTHPIKQAHPDWVIKGTWWKQGMFNLAAKGLRDWKVRLLRELAENYPLDGMQIDFARHTPCLPLGKQWQLRHHVTGFMRQVRTMLHQVGKKKGRPMLLAARIPCSPAGCRRDGFDVARWAQDELVDVLTIGSRSIDCDIEGFKRLIAGRNIKLLPCHDDHHATDAYQYPPIEFFRGVAANWWSQGADGIVTFNWSNARPEKCKKLGTRPGPSSQRQAYREIGSPNTTRHKDKFFVVQRRGGYPWAAGFFNRNESALLPLQIKKNIASQLIPIRVGDHVAADADRIKEVTLRLILFGAKSSERITAKLNNVALKEKGRDPAWKDYQIFSPKPQPSSGGADNWKVDPKQKLLRLDFAIPSRLTQFGVNHVELLSQGAVKLEKVEVHVRYKK